MATETAATTAETRNARKERQGVVVSASQDKTIVVLTTRRYKHRLYAKTMTATKKLHAHDETNDAGVGDTVRIIETRPLSKLKRWRLAEVVERAE